MCDNAAITTQKATGRLRLGCARPDLGMGAQPQAARTRQPVRAGRVDVRGRRSGRQGLVHAGREQLLCARAAPHASAVVGSAVDGTTPGRSAPAEMVRLRRSTTCGERLSHALQLLGARRRRSPPSRGTSLAMYGRSSMLNCTAIRHSLRAPSASSNREQILKPALKPFRNVSRQELKKVNDINGSGGRT